MVKNEALKLIPMCTFLLQKDGGCVCVSLCVWEYMSVWTCVFGMEKITNASKQTGHFAEGTWNPENEDMKSSRNFWLPCFMLMWLCYVAASAAAATDA